MAAGDETGLTIKEYLARIDQKIDAVDAKLDSKADASYVTAMEQRLRSLEQGGSSHAQQALKDVAVLAEKHRAEIDQLWTNINWLRKKVWIAAGAASSVVTILAAIHYGHIQV